MNCVPNGTARPPRLSSLVGRSVFRLVGDIVCRWHSVDYCIRGETAPVSWCPGCRNNICRNGVLLVPVR